MSRSMLEFLRHIRDEVVYLDELTAKHGVPDLLNDPTYSRAVLRSLGIIGEATKRLSLDFRERFPDIEWRSMAGMRDRVVHGYFDVDLAVVTEILVLKIPALRPQIESIIRRLESESGASS